MFRIGNMFDLVAQPILAKGELYVHAGWPLLNADVHPESSVCLFLSLVLLLSFSLHLFFSTFLCHLGALSLLLLLCYLHVSRHSPVYIHSTQPPVGTKFT